MAEWINGIGKITLPTPFAVGDVNVFLVKGDAPTLVDAAINTKETWERFLYELKTLGYEPNDIDQVLLTHHHPDHVGLLDYLHDKPVLGHVYNDRWLIRDEAFMNEYRQFYSKLFYQYSVPEMLHGNIKKMEATLKYSSNRSLSSSLKEGMDVPGLAGWKVIETPGHAQSHISFINEQNGIMIGGDHILATISSNPLLEPPLSTDLSRPLPQLQYNDSLEKVQRYSISRVLTGHGREVSNVSELINRRLGRQHDRAMRVKEMITDQALTGFEICQALFPLAYERELSLTMSETIGQLDYLASLGEIKLGIGDSGQQRYLAR